MERKAVYHGVKRAFDFFSALIAFFVTLPIFLIVCAGIEISDPGPVFYRARRLGKGRKVFDMLKFRSMRMDANADESRLTPDQSRIFPFGRVIRKTKMDELPQLINVILGQMSVVGPRPAAVDQACVTRGGENEMVTDIRPGLTSPAAIYDYLYGDSITDEKEYNDKVLSTRLKLDRYYVRSEALGLDLLLIGQTVSCIFKMITGASGKKLLAQWIDKVDGDRRALDEVK